VNDRNPQISQRKCDGISLDMTNSLINIDLEMRWFRSMARARSMAPEVFTKNPATWKTWSAN